MSENKNTEQTFQKMSEVWPNSPITPMVETTKSFWSRLPLFRHNLLKIWLSLGIMALFLLTLFLTISQIGQRQDIRKKASTAGVRLALIPAQITASANMEYTVVITINTGEEMVSAADLQLFFDPTKLEVQSISQGDFLPVVLVQGKVVNDTASMTLGSQPGEPKKGSGVLASLKIKSLGQTTGITFSNATQVAAIGKTGNVVEQMESTTITVNSEIVATPTPTPIATSASPTPTVKLTSCISCVAPPQGCEYIGSKFCGVSAEVTCGKLVCPTPTPKPISTPPSVTGGFSSLFQTPTSTPARLCQPRCAAGYRPDYTSCSCLPEGIPTLTPMSTPMSSPFTPPTELPPLLTIEPSQGPLSFTPGPGQEIQTRYTKTGNIIVDYFLAFREIFCRLVRFCK